MKNIILLTGIFLSSGAMAQVALGKASISALPANTGINPSISLEFGEYAAPQGKGLVLPWVSSANATTDAVAGTLIYDVNDKIIKYKNSATTWFNLSKNETTLVDGTADFNTTGVVNTVLQNSITDAADAKVSVGNPTSTPGILVLEDANKAMVLPKVPNPHLNIINPEPGTMAYDTVSKKLAVYNGTVWTFWGDGFTSPVPTVTTATGRIWMDRNLGATQVATSVSDPAAYGSLYQWGRLTDGHQVRTSNVITATSPTDVPGHGSFITGSAGVWRSTPNNNLWQGVDGPNNPCPSGFRIPTSAEFAAEKALFASPSAAGAFASPLKLTAGGQRQYTNGSLQSVGSGAFYWTSTVVSGYPTFFYPSTNAGQTYPSYGFAVRCIKN